MSSVLSTFAPTMLVDQGAVVTGGSRGIGRATALALTACGAHVVIGYRRNGPAAEAVCHDVKQHGGRATAIQVDVADAKQVYRFIEQAESMLDSFDILVNCAGVWPQAFVHDLDDEVWANTLAINLNSVFYTCKAASKIMVTRQGGRIINFSSIAVVRGTRSGHVDYAAAKGGVDSLTRSLARELGPHNITVNSVAPGLIRTDMTAEALQQREDEYTRATALARIGCPDEVAGAVLFLVSPAAAYITGQTLHVNGGMWMS